MKIIIKETIELGSSFERECLYYKGKTDEELKQIVCEMREEDKKKGFNEDHIVYIWIQNVKEVD